MTFDGSITLKIDFMRYYMPAAELFNFFSFFTASLPNLFTSYFPAVLLLHVITSAVDTIYDVGVLFKVICLTYAT